jgi:hypothetical protein
LSAVTTDREQLKTEKGKNKITIDSLRQSLQNELTHVTALSTEMQSLAADYAMLHSQEQNINDSAVRA